MLLHMMEVKGRFNSKMVKKAKFGDVHFDETGGFVSVEFDKILGQVRGRPFFSFSFAFLDLTMLIVCVGGDTDRAYHET